MDVTVGICAHNEAQNIGNLLEALLKQSLKSVRIVKIIVISSASTDNTDEIVAAYAQNSKRIVLIRELSRGGKVRAINLLLKTAPTQNIVLISADVIPKSHTVEALCAPLMSPKIGICGGRPIPINDDKTWLGFAVHVVWGLHHLIAKQHPKFGECIAFKKLFTKLPPSAVDEEEIASLILKQGYKGKYVPRAVINNKGPTTIPDFIRQRRRIYAGHLALRSQTGYAPPTMSNFRLMLLLLETIDFKAPFKTGFAIGLEALSRILGYWDFYTGKQHLIWATSRSTKQLT